MEDISSDRSNSDSNEANNMLGSRSEETSTRHNISAARGHTPPPPPLSQVMKYMIPSLLALLPLKHQGLGADVPIFVQNPITLWCFLAATCAYCLIVEEILKHENESTTEEDPSKLQPCQRMMLDRAAIASALLSLISLLTNFLPRRASISLLVIWALLGLLLTWPLLKHAYNLLVGSGITVIVDKASAVVLGWIKGYCEDQEKSLPVYINKNDAPTIVL